MTSDNRWLMLIKDLRRRHGIGIHEAERIALADPAWRRWVEQQINESKPCRKLALNHIRYNGPESLIARDGDRLRVIVQR